MANNSLITQEQYQSDMENLYNDKIKPYLNGASHTGFTPVGTVISYFGEIAPTHFLICDGTAYNKADYPQLWTHLSSLTDTTPYVVDGDNTKFKVPDLRGEFLRGTGTNSHTNQGSGGDVGEHQDGTEIPNLFVANQKSFICYKSDINETCAITNYDKVISTVVDQSYVIGQREAWSDNTPARGTSRPTNTSVLFCIAVKDIYIDTALDGFPVNITNPTDKQGLQYDATSGKWVNGAGGLHEYSTTEKVVGTWIDGRPVYEKIVEITNPTKGTEIQVVTNVAELIDFKSYVKRTPNETYEIDLNFYNNSSDYLFHLKGINKSQHYIYYFWSASASNYTTITYLRAIVQYTKRSDTPTV